MKSISVIIPTHNRATLLPRALDALAMQTLSPASYEVIVVADGCSDTTLKILRDFRAPYQLTFHDLSPGRGAAAARNLGASRADADLLLFLDDDMEASEGLLAAHLEAHPANSGGVVVGYFPMQPPAPGDNPFTKAARLWWSESFEARAAPGHRFTLKDFCTGNISLSRALFERAGGFDEQIDSRGAGEDYEFGYRLIQQGTRFQFARKAESVHHTEIPLSVSLRRAEQEGYGQTILVRRHPELFFEFNVSRLSRIADSIVLRPIWRAVWAFPALAAIPAAILRFVVSTLASLTMYSLLWRFYRPLRGYAYWKGVRAAVGTLAAWERLNQDAPLEPTATREIDLDVAHDLENLELLIGAGPVDAVRVYCNGQPVGSIPASAGAEPLRAEHLRRLLVERFTGVLLGVLTQKTMGMATHRDRSGPHSPDWVTSGALNQFGKVERAISSERE